MKKKTTLLKSLLMALLMVIGATSVSAYSPALTAEYAVVGYKCKAFYNIASENVDNMLPASGDLRYRGGGYGLFNYGSGNRGADITISVENTDLVIFEFKDSQNRSVSINSVSNCTANATVTSGDFKAYDVTADATSLSVNIGRAGCIIAILVMEKDNDVETADYTITYKYGEETVKTSSGNAAVGANIPTDASFFENDVKYIRKDGQSEGFTIVSGANNYTVEVRLAETFSYSLTDNLTGTILNGTGIEGEKAYLPYSRYQIVNGELYEADVTNKEYRKTITLTEDNMTESVNYVTKDGIAKAEFFSEGESIEGMNVSTYGNIPVRASGAKAGVTTEDVVITTLPAGTYKLHVGAFTSKSSEQIIYIGYGETQLAFASSSNLNETASEEFTLSESTEIKYFGTTTSGDAQLDYIWIEKTADILTVTSAGWATFVPSFNVTIPEGVEAYYVSAVSTTATLTQVETAIPAGAPVLLKAAEGTYTFTQAASAAAIDGNRLKISDGEAMNVLVLYNGDQGVGFYNWSTELPAGKVYLDVPAPGRDFIGFSFGEATGINAVESAKENGAVYNLAGQRVAQPTRGLYIVNGKKVVMK